MTGYEPDDLRAILRRFGKFAGGASHHDALNDIVVTMAKNLMPLAAIKAGLSKEAFASGFKRAGMVRDRSVNGYARSSDNWRTFEIGINEGLMLFLHKMVKIFASRISFLEKSGLPAKELSIPRLQAKPAVERLMKAFWDGDAMSGFGFKLVDLPDDQVLIAAHLLEHGECFVVGHEMAHIAINIPNTKMPDLDAMVSWVGSNLAPIETEAGASHTEMRDLARRWGEEVYADYLGVDLLVSSLPKDEAGQRVLAFSSAQLVLIIVMMLETYYQRHYTKDVPLGGHPPGLFRLRCLQLLIGRNNPPQVLQIGQFFEKVANEFLSMT